MHTLLVKQSETTNHQLLSVAAARLHLTSDRITPGDELPQDKSHGINIRLFEGLNVFQVDSGLQDLRGHVPGCAHLRNGNTGGEEELRAGKPHI